MVLRYLAIALAFVFSVSGSVKANETVTAWILIHTHALISPRLDAPFGGANSVGFSSVFESEAECHQTLKAAALLENKKHKKSYKISVIDDKKFRAYELNRPNEVNGAGMREYHCVEVVMNEYLHGKGLTK